MKINLKNLPENINIPVRFKNSYIPVDNTIEATNSFVSDEISKAINSIEDVEKTSFKPIGEPNSIEIQLFNKDGSTKTYSDLGFSNEDLIFRRNRFKNSYLEIRFYDTLQITNRQLLFRSVLYSQLNEYVYDINNNLLDVTSMPVIFKCDIEGYSNFNEAYYQYAPKKAINYLKTFYALFSYQNAADGVSSRMISYNAPVNIGQLFEVEPIKYTFSSINNNNGYSIDTSDRQITIGSAWNIKLYDINLM